MAKGSVLPSHDATPKHMPRYSVEFSMVPEAGQIVLLRVVFQSVIPALLNAIQLYRHCFAGIVQELQPQHYL